jgi:hypothetical protein
MTYTYYYGVMCAGKDCPKFMPIAPYQSTVRAGMTDVNLGSGLLLVCPLARCNFRHCYHTHDVVYSQNKDEMVTLGP